MTAPRRRANHPPGGMSDALASRYLRLLGVPRREPTLAALRELVAAQLQRVPFENVSKLYRFRRSGFRGIPDLERHLDDIERLHCGGTCYANNYHLHRLLRQSAPGPYYPLLLWLYMS